MAGIRIEGNTSGNIAEVTADNELKTIGPQNINKANYGIMILEADDGTVRGTPLRRALDVSRDFRARVGLDTLIFNEIFPVATAINTTQWSQASSTMTGAPLGGFMTINNGNAVASGNYYLLKSYRTFPCYGTFQTWCEIDAIYNAVSPQSNCIVELGFGYVATNAAPTDGAFFRYTATGQLVAVMTINSVETLSSPLTIPSIGEVHHYCIGVGNEGIEFWIDDILVAVHEVPISSGVPTSSMAFPVFGRVNNSGAVSSSVQLKIGAITVTLGDCQTSKPWPHVQAGAGLGGYQTQQGMTLGNTCNWVNSTVPAAATLSNTAAGYTTLGGQFLFTSVAGAETDYAIYGYQLTAGTAAIPGKNFYITDIRVSTTVTTALSTTPTILQWGLGVGATAVSLATADGAGTKAARRLPLGMQCFAASAAIGTTTPDIVQSFNTPLFCENGCFIHVILKLVSGLASGQLRGLIMIQGYWE